MKAGFCNIILSFKLFKKREENMFDLEEELKKLPGKPGVYLMHDKYNHVIYVGKAISLKNRVRQYFQTGRNRTAKIEKNDREYCLF